MNVTLLEAMLEDPRFGNVTFLSQQQMEETEAIGKWFGKPVVVDGYTREQFYSLCRVALPYRIERVRELLKLDERPLWRRLLNI